MALRFYKHGQGKVSRGVAAFAVGLVGTFGCYRLYLWLGARDPFRGEIKPLEGLLPDIPINPALLISMGLLFALLAGIYILSNRPRVADFLLDTEAELKKVSWPSRKEVFGSSVVVMVVVAILGAYIVLLDAVLTEARDGWRWLIDWILGGK